MAEKTMTLRQELCCVLLLLTFAVFASYRQAERNAWIREATESQDYRNGFEDQQNAYILSTLNKQKHHHRRHH